MLSLARFCASTSFASLNRIFVEAPPILSKSNKNNSSIDSFCAKIVTFVLLIQDKLL